MKSFKLFIALQKLLFTALRLNVTYTDNLFFIYSRMKLTLATALCVLTFNGNGNGNGNGMGMGMGVSAFAPSAQIGSSFVGSVQLQSRNVGE